MRLSRLVESQPARKKQLEGNHARKRLFFRSQESLEEQNAFLDVNCSRNARARALESDEHRDTRKGANRSCTAAARLAFVSQRPSTSLRDKRSGPLALICGRDVSSTGSSMWNVHDLYMLLPDQQQRTIMPVNHYIPNTCS